MNYKIGILNIQPHINMTFNASTIWKKYHFVLPTKMIHSSNAPFVSM